MTELHSFIFPIADIQQKVEKDTTYLGKMRSAGEDAGAYDRLRLTEGEDFMFNDFLEQAAAETYNWIKAFGRNVKNAYRIIPDGVLHVINEHLGVRVLLGSEDKGLHSMTSLAATASNPALPYATFEITAETDNDVTYRIDIHSHLNVSMGDASSVGYALRVHYTESVEDTPFMQHRVCSASGTLSADTDLDTLGTFSVTLDKDDFGTHSILSVDSFEVEITDITPIDEMELEAGDFVKYILSDGRIVYGTLTNGFVAGAGEPLLGNTSDIDMRNNVAFVVELPDWTDRNMLPVVESYLAKAIVFYIIYLWFEMTNPKEAERYYTKWEDAAHEAQMGLNTENKTLQRHGHWL